MRPGMYTADYDALAVEQDDAMQDLALLCSTNNLRGIDRWLWINLLFVQADDNTNDTIMLAESMSTYAICFIPALSA